MSADDRQVTASLRTLRSTVLNAGDRQMRSVLVVDVDVDEPTEVARNLVDTMTEAGDDVVFELAESFREPAPGGPFVVVGCPPLPHSADGLDVAPRVDGVVLVVSGGKTRRKQAVDARDALIRVGANILGVVMIQEPRKLFAV